jgi:Cytochrome P460
LRTLTIYLVLLITVYLMHALGEGAGDPRYTASGSLILPLDYREWIFLSSGLGMVYGPATEQTHTENPNFDNVFVSRPAYHAFLKTGHWPDKTMFILEVRSSQSKGSINNGGHFQTGVAAIEGEVKAGGEWTFFAFGRNGTEGKALARTASCYSCHSQNGAVDNTFVQFYPTLLPVATEKGTLKK